ncbi:hypothetical protein DVH05_002319 [Phytophthora capsici]|nr:hypothetical protein DVH05_002319 [Phytophthora capsici]
MGAGKSYRAPATSSPPATPATTAVPSTKDAELVKQIAALIVPEMTSSAEERLKKNAQREFWTEMRERLSVNQSSSGLFVLDQLAEALLDDVSAEDKDMAFTDPVMLLPKPARQREAPNAYVHNRFSNTQDLPDVNVNSAPMVFGKGTPPAKIPSPSKPQKKKKKKSPTKEAATAALLALGQGKPSPKGAKPVTPPSTLGKRKQSSKSDDESRLKIPKPTPTPTPETDYCPYVMTDSTPPSLLQDVEAIYRRAVNMGKTCHQLAYPWEGSKVWYDPAEEELLHVAHWRFWMANQVRFFEWQLNMPYRSSFQRSQRRRQTALARTARLKFISQCIERWGYYGFLKLYEGSEPDRLLMWMGGQPSKNAPDAKQYDGPTIQNLSSLFTQDFEAYKARVKGALKPMQLDQGGFTSITELLVTTNALDPDQKVDCRLSDEALALVRRDVKSEEEPGAQWWVGDLTEGVWARLVNSREIIRVEYELQEKMDKNEYDLPKIPPLRVNEEGHPGYTPIKHRDGTFTALQAAPLEKPIDDRDSDSFEPDTSDEDEVEVIETKAPAPKFASAG